MPRRASSRSSAKLLGSEAPRLFTEPLRRLTKRTTLGYEAIQFAEDVIGMELLPWQKWWLIHALELRPDGQFRYRTIITLVARQNGKTTLLKVVCLYFMYLAKAKLILGVAQSLDIAREAWQGAVDLAEENPELSAEIAAVRRVNGEQCLTLTSGARYRIGAATRGAGRGLSVDLLVLDELREHRTFEAWGALSKTTIARPNALIVGISNAGDDESVVLNTLRSAALSGDDETIGLFEWSAPDGCELDDRAAWAQANPGLGHTISEQAIASAMATDPPATFRTEVLCQKVDALDSAFDVGAWNASADMGGTFDAHRDRVFLGFDVAPDGAHATLVAATSLADGRIRIEPVAAWSSTEAARDALPGLLERIQPKAVAFYPAGPAAALTGLLRPLEGTQELKGATVVETCMSFADLVAARRILHPDDPLLNAHVAGSAKLPSGDGWRFARRGHGHCDAAYAAAAAIHAAVTYREAPPVPRSAIF